MEFPLTFNDKQLRKLMTLVYLGNWMVNGVQNESDRNEDFDNVEQRVYGQAKKLGLDQFVSYDEEANRFYPELGSDGFEEIQKYLSEYSDEIFWYEITNRLAERDMRYLYSDEEIEQMGETERNSVFSKLLKKWADEFRENGIEHLILPQ